VPVCVCVSRVWVCLCVYAQSTGHMVCVSNLCPFILINCSHGTNDDQLKLADVHHNVTPLVASRWYNLGLELGVEPYVLEIIEGGRMKPEECTREMFRRWLNSACGTGSAVRSRKSLLDGVKITFGSQMNGMVEEVLK